MEKNWLIRTKSNHILGPISKDKVIELYQNGSIKLDDEVCSGNGYWFFIRESDLVQKFLINGDTQGFNPISEAKDVITLGNSPSQMLDAPPDDITLIGGINLSLLKSNPNDKDISPHENPGPVHPAKETKTVPQKEIVLTENKKKNNVIPKRELKKAPSPVPQSLKKQSWLKYLGIFGFILLFFLIYFRRPIIDYLFNDDLTLYIPSLIEEAGAQDAQLEKKKRLLESSVTLDGIEFKPTIGFDGFTVTSRFDIEQFSCSDLTNESFQLGILLYPVDRYNEQFLIKVRDCILKLPESNVLKSWIKYSGKQKKFTKEQDKEREFIDNMIQSKFNLITDVKVRDQIIRIIGKIPNTTVSDTLLKSYLYLMIGNITRSDNLLREILRTPPKMNWEKIPRTTSLYHDLASEKADLILNKLAHHPADRTTFQLFILYLRTFYNKEEVLALIDEFETSQIESKINLKVIEGVAPEFVKFYRLANLKDQKKYQRLRNFNLSPLTFQAYWVWAFTEIDPLVSDKMTPELEDVSKMDELWFIYLINNERLADLFSKNLGKIFLPGKRPFLKECLNKPETFMMALYKLIEIGDIHPELVQKTMNHIQHE